MRHCELQLEQGAHTPRRSTEILLGPKSHPEGLSIAGAAGEEELAQGRPEGLQTERKGRIRAGKGVSRTQVGLRICSTEGTVHRGEIGGRAPAPQPMS